MNRRDTIVVAVLINAGVLVVLFTSALKSKAQEEQLASLNPQATSQVVQEVVMGADLDKSASPRDEVDQVIRQYTLHNEGKSSEPSLVAPESKAQDTLSLPSATDFAADLNSFAQSDNTLATAPTFENSPQQAPESHKEVSKGYVEVKVKKGDFLAKIAKRHHTTVEAIMKLNKLTSSNLKIGQILKVPTTSIAAAPAAKPKEVAPASDGAKYYVVRPGDSPWTIAVKNKIKVEDLLRLNNLDAEKAKRLKPGDKLRIR